MSRTKSIFAVAGGSAAFLFSPAQMPKAIRASAIAYSLFPLRRTALLLRVIVDHEHVVDDRAESLGECLVVRIDDVSGQFLLIHERQRKAVREALVLVFLADVHPPFQRDHFLDFVL